MSVITRRLTGGICSFLFSLIVFNSFLPGAVICVFTPGTCGAQNQRPEYSGRTVFNKSVLIVSSIQFCREIITEADTGLPDPGEFQIVPLPDDHRIIKDTPVMVYYEIHNLQTDSLDNVQYRVQFVIQKSAVKTARSRESLLELFDFSSSSYLSLEHKITSMKARQKNYTQIDLSHLEVGQYEFMIIVSDLFAAQNAVGQRHFELVPQ